MVYFVQYLFLRLMMLHFRLSGLFNFYKRLFGHEISEILFNSFYFYSELNATSFSLLNFFSFLIFTWPFSIIHLLPSSKQFFDSCDSDYVCTKDMCVQVLLLREDIMRLPLFEDHRLRDVLRIQSDCPCHFRLFAIRIEFLFQ